MSFSRSLQDHFGKMLFLDYDFPLMRPEYERCKHALLTGLKIAEQEGLHPECVHGHFLPVKYLLLSVKKELTFITWMRDPVERAISHYNYWIRSYDPETAPPPHKQVVEEGWSLERFCLGTEFQNIYSQYLWGFPFDNFDFIGIAEFYEEDLAYFSEKYLQGSLVTYTENVGGAKGKKYEIDAALRKRIEAHHDKDMAFYERAIRLRNKRLQTRPQTS